jgi:hypothetical protein
MSPASTPAAASACVGAAISDIASRTSPGRACSRASVAPGKNAMLSSVE